jgi:hypothetical protein
VPGKTYPLDQPQTLWRPEGGKDYQTGWLFNTGMLLWQGGEEQTRRPVFAKVKLRPGRHGDAEYERMGAWEHGGLGAWVRGSVGEELKLDRIPQEPKC